jgi:hypothetical protein
MRSSQLLAVLCLAGEVTSHARTGTRYKAMVLDSGEQRQDRWTRYSNSLQITRTYRRKRQAVSADATMDMPVVGPAVQGDIAVVEVLDATFVEVTGATDGTTNGVKPPRNDVCVELWSRRRGRPSASALYEVQRYNGRLDSVYGESRCCILPARASGTDLCRSQGCN